MKVAFVNVNNARNVSRGAGYVAGAVLEAGHELLFVDTCSNSEDAVVRDVIGFAPEVLLVSSMTMLFPQARRLVRDIKAQTSAVALVGGVHATLVGASLLEDAPEIDFLCIGEGESMVPEFLARLGTDALYETENLVFRRDGAAVANPIRPAEDLSGLPPFPWDLFPDGFIVDDTGFAYVHGSRGCPYSCSYCGNSAHLRLYGKSYLRHRPIEDVIEEVRWLNERFAPRLCYFGDEMIFFDTAHARKLFTALHAEVGVPYGAMARAEYLTPELVAVLAETGCRYIAIGVECGDEEFRRKHLKRTMSNAQIEGAFRLTREAGIFRTSFNMLGFPFAGDEQLTRATEALNERIQPDSAQFTVFYPFPGTRLYDYCVERDLIDPAKANAGATYHQDSILRGVSVRAERDRLDARFNPYGFSYSFARFDPDASVCDRLKLLGAGLRRRLGLRTRLRRFFRRERHRSGSVNV